MEKPNEDETINRRKDVVVGFRTYSRQSTPPTCCEKSTSSGYGGSSQEPIYVEHDYKPITNEDTCQHKQLKNVIKKENKCRNNNNKTGDSITNVYNLFGLSSGTLTTIPEGIVDFTIPRPIWPKRNRMTKIRDDHDTLIDDNSRLFTNQTNDDVDDDVYDEQRHEETVRDVLVDLLHSVNEAIDGKLQLSQEEVLRRVNERINFSLDIIRQNVEDDMRKLSINIVNNKKVNSVVKAFESNDLQLANKKCYGDATNDNDANHRSNAIDNVVIDNCYYDNGNVNGWNFLCSRQNAIDYEQVLSSTCTSSGDSVSVGLGQTVFVHDDLSSVKNGLRNAMIYGTLCRNNQVKIRNETKQKKSSLRAKDDGKPSVWEQYYGLKILPEAIGNGYVPKPTDVPLYVSFFCFLSRISDKFRFFFVVVAIIRLFPCVRLISYIRRPKL